MPFDNWHYHKLFQSTHAQVKKEKPEALKLSAFLSLVGLSAEACGVVGRRVCWGENFT
jgi:hypothetical protein